MINQDLINQENISYSNFHFFIKAVYNINTVYDNGGQGDINSVYQLDKYKGNTF